MEVAGHADRSIFLVRGSIVPTENALIFKAHSSCQAILWFHARAGVGEAPVRVLLAEL